MLNSKLSAERLRSIVLALAFPILAGGASDSKAQVPRPGTATVVSVQAQRMQGQKLFDDKCASCHVVNGSKGPPLGLTGDSFARRWRSANDLYVRILNTMPKDR